MMKPLTLLLFLALLSLQGCRVPSTGIDGTADTRPPAQTSRRTADSLSDRPTLDSLRAACQHRMLSAEYLQAAEIGTRMEELARRTADEEAMLWACGYKGTALLAADSTDAAFDTCNEACTTGTPFRQGPTPVSGAMRFT